MSDIFHKTTLGYEEIASRKNGLSIRLRRCLILIDGKRNLGELMSLFPNDNLASLIQTLELDGYIELIGVAQQNAPVLATSESMFEQKMGSTMYSHEALFHSRPMYKDSKGQLRQPLAFEERKLRASRVINELLGPNAEGIALRIEQTKDEDTLELVLKMAAVFIADTVNPIATQRFKDYVRLSHEDS